jgi:two-component system chemotaxis sensor kinase CheA
MNAIQRLLKAIVLPPQITQFERDYLARMNRIALVFFAAHVPFLAAVAFFNDTGPLNAVVLTSFGVLGPWLARRSFSNPRHTSMAFGVTSMFMGALLVHFGRGLWTIEMHFYFFVALALLAVFANPVVILTAATTVALHHLVLWFLAPRSVFNYDAPLSSVLLHATFVIVESVAACFVARSFFDNVIGLERIVADRTAALDGRNREMRLVFDHVHQGFLTVDGTGALAAEHSRAAGEWFGAPKPGQTLWSFFASHDPAFAQWLELGWFNISDGLFPMDVAFAQLPSRFSRGSQWWEVQYQPVLDGGKLTQVLISVTDVTERLERERGEIAQRETMAIFERLMRDRSGFLDFFAEAKEAVTDLTRRPPPSDERARRIIHTLKGNAALFGLSSIARVCHDVESRIADQNDVVEAHDRDEVAAAWETSSARVVKFLEGGSQASVELDESEYLAIVQAIDRGAPRGEVMELIASWRNERVRVRFERFAEQARALASRLGKGPVEVVYDGSNLRLPRDRFSKVWSSLTHVLRNAVDHGLLPSEERQGKVELSARMERGELVVTVRDNGRGVDWQAVRERAEARGLPHASEADLCAALFASGLSTREQVNEFSGRGVGMGAVKEALEALQGWIDVQSKPGEGTAVVLHFPAQVASEGRDLRVAA